MTVPRLRGPQTLEQYLRALASGVVRAGTFGRPMARRGLIEIKAPAALPAQHAVPTRLEGIMPFALQIASRNMDTSESAASLVRERASDLEHYAQRINACRVVLECINRPNRVGRLYRVHIDLTVPGGTVVVNREGGKNHVFDDLQLAIRDAFDNARRQLQDRQRRMDGAEKRAVAQ